MDHAVRIRIPPHRRRSCSRGRVFWGNSQKTRFLFGLSRPCAAVDETGSRRPTFSPPHHRERICSGGSTTMATRASGSSSPERAGSGGRGISSRGRSRSLRWRRLLSASSMIHGGGTCVMAFSLEGSRCNGVAKSSCEEVEKAEQGERGGGRRCARPRSLRRGTRPIASPSASRRRRSRRPGRPTFDVSTGIPVQLTPQESAGRLCSVSHVAPPDRGYAVAAPRETPGAKFRSISEVELPNVPARGRERAAAAQPRSAHCSDLERLPPQAASENGG